MICRKIVGERRLYLVSNLGDKKWNPTKRTVLRCRFWGSGYGVWGVEFRVKVSRFRVYGSSWGFRFQFLGFGIWS